MVRVPPRESAISDAKKAARQILEKGIKSGNMRGPTYMRRELLRLNTLQAFSNSDSPSAKMVVELARNGDKDANAVLCGMARGVIAAGRTPPPILRDYTVHLLNRLSRSEDFPAKSGQRGRKAHTNFRRNFAIVGAVGELVACGFRPTSNDDGSERECACSIVADLLKDLG